MRLDLCLFARVRWILIARTRNLHVFEMLEMTLAALGADSLSELVRAYFPCYVDLIAVRQGT
jgi:hypothetical protein